MNAKWHIFQRLSFHIGGLLSSIWPVRIIVAELLQCPATHWKSMCGMGLVLGDPPGYFLGLPLSYLFLTVLHVLNIDNDTFSYVVGVALPVLIVHYLIGGILGVIIQEKMHFSMPDVRPRSIAKNMANLWKKGP